MVGWLGKQRRVHNACKIICSRLATCFRHVSCVQLPGLWLAYLADPSDSGKIHSNVRQRYDSGDEAVIEYVVTYKTHCALENCSNHVSLEVAKPTGSQFPLRLQELL